MSKKGKLKAYVIVSGLGKDCPKCKKPMERRKRIKAPANKIYYFREWDYCKDCGHLQHYDEFKSTEWQEAERIENVFNSLKY